MTDHFFLGNFFFQQTPISAVLIGLLLLFSLFPSMFQVSSLLLLNPGSPFSYRQFTGLFTCNHPDTLMLAIFMVYFGRAFEFHRGILPTLMVLFVSLCAAIGISFASFLGGQFVLQYALIIPASFAAASLFHTQQTWIGDYKINEKMKRLD